jgi:hypothetical protein
MTLAREFTSALALLKELRAQGEPDLPELDLPPLPSLDTALASLPPVPAHALLLGVANDGMPLMLDLRDPAPGPVLVVGDSGSGKTDFLRFAAAALMRTHRPDEAQFYTLTPAPAEWSGFEEQVHCLRIVDLMEGGAHGALERLADSMQEKRSGSAVLLLVDDLTMVDPEALGVLAWALAEGPRAGLWPLVTVNTEAALVWSEWLELFHTRIFAQMASPEAARALAPAPDGGLDNLLAGAQFSLRSGGHWLRFWAPLA